MSSGKDVAFEDKRIWRKMGKAHYIYFMGFIVEIFKMSLCKTFLTSTVLNMKK